MAGRYAFHKEFSFLFSSKKFAWPWMLVIVAWSLIIGASLTRHLYLIDHDYLLQSSHLPWWLALIIFLGDWQIMTAAMMLPALLPLLSLSTPLDLYGATLWSGKIRFLLGYALTWSIFASVAFFGDLLVHRLVNSWFWLYTHSWLIGIIVLSIAGMFQLSPFKRRCLEYCQLSSCGLDTLYRQPWRVAWRYGWSCIGSCWSLMLLMFAIGTKNILSLAGLAMIILIEKLHPAGSRWRIFIGAAFLVLAASWLAFSSIH